VLDRALALGFDAVCTGHYARIDTEGALNRAVDEGKDQSYVLAVLTRDQIAHAMFPLGDTPKTAVREEARDRGLLVADKPDSHDICFIADGDTAGFLNRELGARPGAIVDEDGSVLARHDASYAFTVGQRRGLGLDRPAADGRRRYVLAIEPVSRTVTVGPHERLAVGVIRGIRPRWCGSPPDGVLDCGVQIRAHGEEFRARVRLDGAGSGDRGAAGSDGSDRGGAESGGEGLMGGNGPYLAVELTEPAVGVAPGQTVVLYDGTRVIGSATIAATTPADVPVR
jgi:tRNA-specific 2-thiouridylase